MEWNAEFCGMDLNMIIYVTSTLLLAAEIIKQYKIFKGIVHQKLFFSENLLILRPSKM